MAELPPTYSDFVYYCDQCRNVPTIVFHDLENIEVIHGCPVGAPYQTIYSYRSFFEYLESLSLNNPKCDYGSCKEQSSKYCACCNLYLCKQHLNVHKELSKNSSSSHVLTDPYYLMECFCFKCKLLYGPTGLSYCPECSCLICRNCNMAQNHLEHYNKKHMSFKEFFNSCQQKRNEFEKLLEKYDFLKVKLGQINEDELSEDMKSTIIDLDKLIQILKVFAQSLYCVPYKQIFNFASYLNFIDCFEVISKKFEIGYKIVVDELDKDPNLVNQQNIESGNNLNQMANLDKNKRLFETRNNSSQMANLDNKKINGSRDNFSKRKENIIEVDQGKKIFQNEIKKEGKFSYNSGTIRSKAKINPENKKNNKKNNSSIPPLTMNLRERKNGRFYSSKAKLMEIKDQPSPSKKTKKLNSTTSKKIQIKEDEEEEIKTHKFLGQKRKDNKKSKK